MTPYTYRLGKMTTVCPQCHRRTFKPYVDTAGNILDPTCGRCNRELNCQYHLPPRQFFRDHPTLGHRCRDNGFGYSSIDRRFGYGRLTSARSTAYRPRSPDTQPSSPDTCQPSSPDFITGEQLESVLKENNNGTGLQFCPVSEMLRRRFSMLTFANVTSAYRLEYIARGNYTLYLYIDAAQRIRSGKLMRYTADAHRDKIGDNATKWLHSIKGIPADFNYVGAFFGSHLIGMDFHPDGCIKALGSNRHLFGNDSGIGHAQSSATVIVVESEKSALVVASWLMEHRLFDRYRVIATGGSSGINIDSSRINDPYYKYAPLLRRRLILIPDADAYDKWDDFAMRNSRYFGYIKIMDIRRMALTPTDDIADIILHRRTRR